ncbi:hypothetical protein T492DRAFT_1100241 [Pavlovales sp. CCMP2436]|nr:hypothetical protein T492DRAFT_1100241 [Pavlovales sp. CCMP2436]|mmetsp:Transcript_18582/g.43818  ORF Transcript_18582/g.43818 Transcript_18582/m.43818 type:complete len:234 (+) Transcript_18582:364-1065(+)
MPHLPLHAPLVPLEHVTAEELHIVYRAELALAANDVRLLNEPRLEDLAGNLARDADVDLESARIHGLLDGHVLLRHRCVDDDVRHARAANGKVGWAEDLAKGRLPGVALEAGRGRVVPGVAAASTSVAADKATTLATLATHQASINSAATSIAALVTKTTITPVSILKCIPSDSWLIVTDNVTGSGQLQAEVIAAPNALHDYVADRQRFADLNGKYLDYRLQGLAHKCQFCLG